MGNSMSLGTKENHLWANSGFSFLLLRLHIPGTLRFVTSVKQEGPTAQRSLWIVAALMHLCVCYTPIYNNLFVHSEYTGSAMHSGSALVTMHVWSDVLLHPSVTWCRVPLQGTIWLSSVGLLQSCLGLIDTFLMSICSQIKWLILISQITINNTL